MKDSLKLFLVHKICKVNFVQYVKLILSYTKFNLGNVINIHYFSLYVNILRALLKISLDIGRLLNIIKFTLFTLYLHWGNNNAKQDKNSQRKCYFQHSSEEGYRSIISRARIFRCQRSITDKIRNVKESFSRRLAYLEGNQIIWFFKAVFLQSAYKLSSQRIYWITTLQKRPPKTAQIFGTDNVPYKIINYRRSRHKITGYSKQTTNQIWIGSTSSKYRKGLKAGEKKTAAHSSITFPTAILDQYEILRSLVIEGTSGLPPNYWTLINQGMLVWAEKFEPISYQQNKPITKIKQMDNSIINILVDMVIYERQEKSYVCQ